MSEWLLVILLILYVGISVWLAYKMGEVCHSIFYGILTFFGVLAITPILGFLLLYPIIRSEGY